MSLARYTIVLLTVALFANVSMWWSARTRSTDSVNADQVRAYKKAVDGMEGEIAHQREMVQTHKAASKNELIKAEKYRVQAKICDAKHAELEVESKNEIANLENKIANLERELEKAKLTVKKLSQDGAKRTKANLSDTHAKVMGSQLEPVRESYLCPGSVSNNQHWQSSQPKLQAADKIKTNGDFLLPKRKEWFCDKLISSLEKWIHPKVYGVDDLAVGIFSGEKLYWGQVTSQLDTWMAQIPASHTFAATEIQALPVSGLKQFGAEPDYQNQLSAQMVQLYAYKELYRMHPDKKWYLLFGSDNYINVDYLLRVLDRYDATEALWLAPSRNEMPEMYPWLDTSVWPKYKEVWGNAKNGKGEPVDWEWALGSNGWIVTNRIMKDYADNLDKFLDVHDLRDPKKSTKKIGYAPDKVTGLLLSLLGYRVRYLPWEEKKEEFRGDPLFHQIGDKWMAGRVHAPKKQPSKETIGYHYVSAREMLAADQRAQHEKLDRMINAGDPNAIVHFFREMLDRHYRVLRNKQVQVKWLAIQAASKPGENPVHVHSSWGNPSYFGRYDDIPLTVDSKHDGASAPRGY